VSIAIGVDQVYKRFRIPVDRSTTLKYRFAHPLRSSRYRDLLALQNVSFQVAAGEFLGIIGHNGSGKSTLLKILSHIYEPSTGVVRINGKVSPFLELGVGFHPELTARENVYLSGAILGLTRPELSRRMEAIISFAELEAFADQKLKNFSSGMQVRLAFSVAIQANAAILLMDEVLAVGDASFQEKCFDVFAGYKREGRTVVLVTHDLGAVDLYCDRALLLDHGRLIHDGAVGEVTGRYRRMVGQRISTGSSSHDTLNRWGSREVEIKAVSFLDEGGNASLQFTTGQPMTIKIDYEVHQDVGELVFGLAFHRSDGLNLAGPNTRVGGMVLQCPPPGSARALRYRIDAVPFLTGAYRLTAAIYDRHARHPYDHIEQAFAFRVTDEGGRAGMVELGGTWIAS